MFSMRDIRELPRNEQIKIKRQFDTKIFSRLKPRQKFIPLFIYKAIVKKMFRITDNQLKTIK